MAKKISLIVFVLLVGIASAGLACETCPYDPELGYMCHSGDPDGFQSCYGGFPFYCTMQGKCTGGGAPMSAVVPKDTTRDLFGRIADRKFVAQVTPRGGFTLER